MIPIDRAPTIRFADEKFGNWDFITVLRYRVSVLEMKRTVTRGFNCDYVREKPRES